MITKIHITVNSRLTQLLKSQLIEFQQDVVETPQVMTMSQWWDDWQTRSLLRGELASNALPKRVLSSFESQQIWEKLLNDSLDYALLNSSTTVKYIEQAWHLLQEYSDLTQLENCFSNEEVQLFIQLQSVYQQALKKQRLADKSLLQKIRLEQLAKGCGQLPQQFVLHGFDELPPFMKQWQNIVESRGSIVTLAPLQTQPAKQQVFVANSLKDESQQVANWVVTQLVELKKYQKLADIRIGIVAPNLNDVLFETQWAIEEKLCHLGYQPLSQEQGWLNISLGQPLNQVFLVKNALLTLDMFSNPDKTVRYDDWSSWLLSPYTQDNFALRHALDVQLRKLQWASFKWTNLLASEQIKKIPKAMRSCLEEQAKISLKSKLTLAEFVEESFALLERLHWAKSQASGALSSREFQQKQTFLTHLANFKSYHLMPISQDFHAWLHVFKSSVAEQVHQPQSGKTQPIQLLGMLEAGGQTFDALWLMGLNDESWPRMPAPNPFLPLDLQKKSQQHISSMPRCDAERELDYAQSLMKRFIYSAKQIVWSYAKQKGPQTFMASPLLDMSLPLLPLTKYESLANLSWLAKSPLQWIEDAKAPEVIRGTKVLGGTAILTAQNTCPLMAFMDYRLGTKYGIEPVEDCLKSASLGNLIHKVLEGFWADVKTHASLLSKSAKELEKQLTDLIAIQILPLKQRFAETYLTLESQRILELLLDWVELEKQRNTFSVIANELEAQIAVGGIQFHITIDRIDKVNSELLIIDYKTGRANVADLYSEKMSAPQLAIYLYGTASFKENVAGLGYAILHSDDGVKINMVIDEAERLHAKKPAKFNYFVFDKLAEKDDFEYAGWQWQDFLEQLKQEVNKLAISIQQGQAEMVFEDEKDLTYAGCLLALRLPEVNSQKV